MNFFTPPPVIKAELFLRIPDSMRCIGQDSEWRGGFTRPFQDIFLEGPVADSAGNLFVVDIPYGRILQINANKEVEICATWDGEPNGLAATPDGQLLVADYKQVHVLILESTYDMLKVDLVIIDRVDVDFATTGHLSLRPRDWIDQAIHDTSSPREVQRTQRPCRRL